MDWVGKRRDSLEQRLRRLDVFWWRGERNTVMKGDNECRLERKIIRGFLSSKAFVLDSDVKRGEKSDDDGRNWGEGDW